MFNGEIFGLPIPDAGLVFVTALAAHIVFGVTAVAAGALAAVARKKAGRHPHAGRVYLWALGGIFATAIVMAIIRWREDANLFAVAVIAFGLGLYGYRAHRRHRPGWPPRHAVGMGGSYIALLTGFYVDNGAFLPLWNQLPHIAYWFVPSVVGVPLIWLALHRYQRNPRVDSTDRDGTQMLRVRYAFVVSSTVSRVASWRIRPGRAR